MNTNIEIESKTLLTKEEYDLLFMYFSNKSYIQTNYYIDTKEKDLIKNGCSCRLRIKENSAEFTIKIPKDEGRQEFNFPISLNEAEDILKREKFDFGPVFSMLKSILPNYDFFFIGSLETERVDMEYKSGLLSLDLNKYNNNIDYEIEYEGTSKKEANQTLKDFLKEKGINRPLISISKMKRALNN